MNFKIENVRAVLLVLTLVSGVLAVSTPKVRAQTATVIVMPQALEFGPSSCIGTEFTVTVEIHDVSDLYGFDIKFGWDTTWIQYVSHEYHIPVETYPDGVLHEVTGHPVWILMDTVWEGGIPGAPPGTMYWLAAASEEPSPSFDGNGIAFDMVFEIIDQPGAGEADAVFDLKITESDLSSKAGWPILHDVLDATVTIHALGGIPGDIMGDTPESPPDGDVDQFDLEALAGAYGSKAGEPRYIALADLNHDNIVDAFDLLGLGKNYGTGLPP